MNTLVSNKDYIEWIASIRDRVRQSQIKAAVTINSELIAFNLSLGKSIAEVQSQCNWGDKLITQMSKDLKYTFPNMKGFSVSNLKYCKQVYLFYSQESTFSHQVGGQFLQKLLRIPWRHHIEIVAHSKTIDEAVFYIDKTIQNNWSRAVLIHFIEQDLYSAQGKAITNFDITLPDPQSDLAQQTLKDPYIFDFLSMTENYKERDLEEALSANVINFLMELGSGFAFVSRQYPIEIDGESYRIDLLFYHLMLRCYIVVELKTGKFKPEYAGKIGFYISAIDEIIRQANDNPTIGLIICKSKKETTVRYALQHIDRPIGVSQYELSKLLPDNYKSSLPSIEEVENELNK